MPRIPRSTTIYCPRQLRALWPNPIAKYWLREYPILFDRDDLRLTQTQPRNHFNEWYAAIHVYQVYGALSLVEKYIAIHSHPRKQRLFEQILSSRQIGILSDIIDEHHANPPDLLAYTPDHRRFWFVEVKGPGDRLMEKQIRSHSALRRRLGVPVQVIDVIIQSGAAA